MMATPKIYIDSCCLIESIKGMAGAADPARERGLEFVKRIIRAARENKMTVYTSLLTVAEVVKASDTSLISDDIRSKIERLILSGKDGLTVVGISPRIAIRARDLAWVDGLMSVKGADRLHLAAALSVGAKEFLSWDNRLGRKLERSTFQGTRLIDPTNTLLLPDEYRQGGLFPPPPPPAAGAG